MRLSRDHFGLGGGKTNKCLKCDGTNAMTTGNRCELSGYAICNPRHFAPIIEFFVIKQSWQ